MWFCSPVGKHLMSAKYCAWHWIRKVNKTDTIPTFVNLGSNCNPPGRKYKGLSKHRRVILPRQGRSVEAFHRKGEPTRDGGKDC